ncbi:MAG: tRNA epoxyqueuosine(34) reductase QueG [Candidatus Dormibacteria bacterium]
MAKAPWPVLNTGPADGPPSPGPAAPAAARKELEHRARQLGFTEVGVTDLAPFTKAAARAQAAIAQGRMAGMPWYTEERVEQARDLGARFPWGRSLVALAYPYAPAGGAAGGAGRGQGRGRPRGRIAAYALGEDYHRRLDRALASLAQGLAGLWPGLRWHRFVDHGRALDRAIAERAGIGFCGKNTQLLTISAGSYVLLASLVLSIELAPDRTGRRQCGSCRRCLPSCPTGALLAPGVIDARRCISYLTIEHQGPVPERLRPLLGTWVFGCDLCQEACPINQRLAPRADPDPGASTRSGPVPQPDLVELLELDEASFRSRFARTTLARSGRERLARNAALGLGNAGLRRGVPALERALTEDGSAVVRGACAWSLGRLGGPRAERALQRARARERDPVVRREVRAALARQRPSKTFAAAAPGRARAGFH